FPRPTRVRRRCTNMHGHPLGPHVARQSGPNFGTSCAREFGHHGRMGSGARAVASLTLAATFGAGTLLVVDRVVGRMDLGYTAARSVPNDDRRLVRPEFSVEIRTNALGFREPRLPGPKPPGTLRIVALGDSFTQG